MSILLPIIKRLGFVSYLYTIISRFTSTLKKRSKQCTVPNRQKLVDLKSNYLIIVVMETTNYYRNLVNRNRDIIKCTSSMIIP